MNARRIVAGVSGSPGSLHAPRQAAELARQHDALLIPPLAWLPPGSASHPWPELRQLWHDDAWQRLRDTLDAAFGGLPAGIATQPAVLRGNPGKVLTGVARQDGDLLIIGAGAGVRCGGYGQPHQPLLPGPRLLPGAGHPGPLPGPAGRPWPARLGGPAPPDPGNSPARIAEPAAARPRH